MQVSSFSMVLIIGFDRAKENLHLNSKDLNTNYSYTSQFVIQEALGIVLISKCFRTLCGLLKELQRKYNNINCKIVSNNQT